MDPAAPWLSASAIHWAVTILRSHQLAFRRPLLAGYPELGDPCDPDLRAWAQALFAAPAVVLAHDAADPAVEPGPRLIYANRAALLLWRRRWDTMVGMPSQSTAEPGERPQRRQALQAASSATAISAYSGVRIDSQGRRFQLRGARLWTLWDTAGRPCGQAARFSDWHWLR